MKFIKPIIYSLIFLASLVFVDSASAATNVYYSVGQNATDHSSGGNVSIASGVATFTVAQAATNLGVGDRLTAGGNVYYLASKTSTTVWNVITATGGIPADLGSTAVTSIAHEYTTLSAAEAGATDSNHLNTTDLVAGNYILNFPCYYDSAADTTAVTVNGYTTGENNYIKIYTPNNTTTEANTSQRHQGKWDTSKYYLEVINGNALYNNDNYVRIDGLQVNVISTSSGSGRSVITNDADSNILYSEVHISNNIARAQYSGETGSGGGIILSPDQSDDNNVSKAWNNIVYDINFADYSMLGIQHSQGKGIIYNNTVYNCRGGISKGSGGDSYYLKNNIVIGDSINASFTDYSGFSGSACVNNISSDATSPNSGATDCGGHSCRNQTVSFADEANDDFHLSETDTSARNAGTDLSADADLPFSTDIDNQTRSNHSWDIGADEAAEKIYRSVGPGEDEVLETGTANHLNISGSTATFDTALGDDVGVGDALEYDDDNDGDIDASDSIAFITSRTSSTVFTIKTSTGAAPTTPSAADEIHWNINRAYTSLFNAEAGTENTRIDPDLIAFDAGNRDIVTYNEQWNIACYAHGTTADQTTVTIDGWTTDASHYLKIYTPTTTNEVGTSQRHQGKWDENKYRLIADGLNNGVLSVEDNYIKIIGLQIDHTGNNSSYAVSIIEASTADAGNECIVSDCVIKDESTGSGVSYGIWTNATNRIVKAYNNIIYDLDYGIDSRIGATYSYNNTIIDCASGLKQEYTATHLIKNNIVKGSGNTNAYSGSATYINGDYNATDGTDTTGQGANSKISQTIAFADEANDDFHLSSFDTSAKNAGTDLSADTYLPFTDDIDGEARGVDWSIGADEPFGAEVQSSSLGQQSLTDGLVLYQPFDGSDIIGTTSFDRSGNDNNGTISGAVPVIGKNGQGLSFDGSSSYVNVSNDVNTYLDFGQGTISFWYRSDITTGDPLPTFFSFLGAGANQGDSLSVYSTTTHNIALLHRSDYSGYRTLSVEVPYFTSDREWRHVVAAWDINGGSETLSLTFDGTRSIDSDVLTEPSSYSGTAYIGAGSNGTEYFLDGSMDEVRLYNRALSSTEIASLYNLDHNKINSSLSDKSTTGLVGYWTFDGPDINMSTNTAYDRSPAGGNNGTITGATPVIGKNGQALSFDGDDYITIGDSDELDGSSAMTWSFWVKLNDTGSSTRGVFNKYVASNGARSYLITINGSENISLRISSDGINYEDQIATTSLDTNWNHIAVVFNSGTFDVYKNGQIVSDDGDFSSQTSIYGGTANLVLGLASGLYMNGKLDETRMYSRALSETEIVDLYNLGKAKIKN